MYTYTRKRNFESAVVKKFKYCMTLGEKEIYLFKETLLRDLTFRRITTLKIKLIAKGFKKIKCSKIHIHQKKTISLS